MTILWNDQIFDLILISVVMPTTAAATNSRNNNYIVISFGVVVFSTGEIQPPSTEYTSE